MNKHAQWNFRSRAIRIVLLAILSITFSSELLVGAITVTHAAPSAPRITQVKGVHEGQAIQGNLTVQVFVTGRDMQRVIFRLHGPKPVTFIEEKRRPYYFLGKGDRGVPNGWDTTEYPNGRYILTILAISAYGHSELYTLHLRISNIRNNTPDGDDPTPTHRPSSTPRATERPSEQPTATAEPATTTENPSAIPTTTLAPSEIPAPTEDPSAIPTATERPTGLPSVTEIPTELPTELPTATETPADNPTATLIPSDRPSNTPTERATDRPSSTPTVIPSVVPSNTPTTRPSSTPRATNTRVPPPALGGSLTLPIRAAFYYPWFPEAWDQLGINPYTKYHPTQGFYDSGNASVIQQHIEAMVYGNIDAGIASWWGQGKPTDGRIQKLLDGAAGRNFRWGIYYEKEGFGNPSVAELQSDLIYLRDHYSNDPAFARINGHFLVFVYGDAGDDCSTADRWKQANTVGAYVVLKVFPGYQSCASQPNSWHQYAPAGPADAQGHFSYTISPGFNKAGEATRLGRDLARWQGNVQAMVASGADFQLITTFNEWGEGTSVEPATEWASPSGYGTYLDALHANP